MDEEERKDACKWGDMAAWSVGRGDGGAQMSVLGML